MEKIDVKLLKGLNFKTSERREGKDEDGKKTVKHVAVERALKAEDVLDWKDLGNEVVIVSADGRKYRVEKNAKEADAKGSGADAKA